MDEHEHPDMLGRDALLPALLDARSRGTHMRRQRGQRSTDTDRTSTKSTTKWYGGTRLARSEGKAGPNLLAES